MGDGVRSGRRGWLAERTYLGLDTKLTSASKGSDDGLDGFVVIVVDAELSGRRKDK